MAFQNSSFYILPLSVPSVSTLEKYLLSGGVWSRVDKSERRSDYLFDYVSRIVDDEECCSVFRHSDPGSLPIYTFENELTISAIPEISQVNLYVFRTGVGFLELKVEYGELSVDEIVNFAYFFKMANRAEKAKYAKGDKKSLYRVCLELFPEEKTGVRSFFANRSELKYQAMCFHMVKTSYSSEEERDTLLFRLKRSYTSAFVYDRKNDFGEYDMTYAPYEYLAFGGCQEGFAAICHDTDIPRTNFFLNEYLYEQLTRDYHYMYLILLNQRLSEMKYIEEIAVSEDTKELVEQISKKIIHLKTKYSFHVVSDDYIYQNIYSKLYEIFDIDKLFLDIEENGDRLALVQSNDSAETEKENNNFLMCISLLAIFSALVDLAAYLDRMSIATLVSTVVSAIGVLAVIGYAAWKMIKKRVKKKRKGKRR